MFHIKHERILDFLEGNPESPQEHCHKSKGTLISPQLHESALVTPTQLEMRADSLASTQLEYRLPQAPQEEASLSCSIVRGTLNLLPQVEWTPRCPDSK